MITEKIERLARGIAFAEGWGPVMRSISYRNHNPGALRRSRFQLGTRNGFAFFLNDNIGFFALCYDLSKKCKGETSTILSGNSSLLDLIKIYTEEQDLDILEVYIKRVLKVSDIPGSTELRELIK